jgi:D-serine deaminase-like pyridoxal phosphate-dependent protein
MSMAQCDTPVLLLDMDIAEHNINRMGEFFRGKKAHLRPHVKVHKSPFLAHKQIAAGAKGITCAKASEAEVMANAGIDDILIANEIVGEVKLKRLAGLARECRLEILVDNAQNAKHISRVAHQVGSKIGVLVELNLGGTSGLDGILDRCGVPPGHEALKLAREIEALENLEFRGLMGYEGSLRKFVDVQSRKEAVEKSLGLMVETKDGIEDSGISVGDVSCGGTMSYDIASQIPGVTEIQAGSYLFMDTTYRKYGVDFEFALTVLVSIISRPRPDKAIVDVGLKAISLDHGLPTVKGRPELECVALNAEHGHFRLLEPKGSLAAGDKIELLPTHVDTTVCLHDSYVLVRRGEVESVLGIPGRGKLQ